MVLALCNSPHDPLSVYQVTFNSLLYFQRYASDKLFIAKILKGSNSKKIGDRVMVLALQFSSWPSISVLSFIQFPCILSEICPRLAFYCKN